MATQKGKFAVFQHQIVWWARPFGSILSPRIKIWSFKIKKIQNRSSETPGPILNFTCKENHLQYIFPTFSQCFHCPYYSQMSRFDRSKISNLFQFDKLCSESFNVFRFRVLKTKRLKPYGTFTIQPPYEKHNHSPNAAQ